jgi:hypothetical protein
MNGTQQVCFKYRMNKQIFGLERKKPQNLCHPPHVLTIKLLPSVGIQGDRRPVVREKRLALAKRILLQVKKVTGKDKYREKAD